MDIHVCRVCLQEQNENTHLVSIFSLYTAIQEKPQTFSNLLLFCTNTQVNKDDDLPKHICSDCTAKLCTSYNFKIQCEASYNYLLSSIKNNAWIKLENEREDLNIKGEEKWGIDVHEIFENIEDEPEEHKMDMMKDRNDKKNANVNFFLGRNKRKKEKISGHTSVKGKSTNKMKLPIKKGKNTNNITGCMCIICNKTFPYQYLLRDHEQAHYATKSYHCRMCNKYYTSEKSHKRYHLRMGEYTCDVCKKTFQSKHRIYQHMMVHDTSRLKFFKCNFTKCCKIYVSKNGLNRHMLVHEGKKNFMCELCSKSFFDKYDLQSHLKGTHFKVKNYACNVCIRTFTSSSKRNEHMKRHLNIKPHSCEYCGKKFYDKSHLTRHIAIHQKDMKFLCRFCPKRFVRPDAKQRHENVMHGIGAAAMNIDSSVRANNKSD